MYWWLFYFFWLKYSLWKCIFFPCALWILFLSALSSEPPDIVLLTTGISVHPCSFVFPQFVSIRSVLNIYHLPLAHPPLISVSLSPSPWSSSSFSPSLCSTPPSDLLCLCVASHGQWCGKGLHYSQSRHPSEWLWKQPPGPVLLPHPQSSPISSHHQAQRMHRVTLSPLILSLLSVAGHHCKHSIPWDQTVLQK